MSAGVQATQKSFADLIGKLDLIDAEIRLSDIRTPPLGPEPDNAFVRSVCEIGILSPVLVEAIPVNKGGGYTMIDGYRRLRAAIECELETIPARIAPPGAYTVALLTLIANEQRSPNPVVEYYALYGLMENNGLSETEIARLTGMSVPTIRKRLGLGSLIPEFMAVFEMGELSAPMADKLAKLSTADQAKCLAVWNEHAGRLTAEDIRRVREADRKEAAPELPGMPDRPREYTAASLIYEVRRLRDDMAIGSLDLVEVDQRLAVVETIAAGLAALVDVDLFPVVERVWDE
jgi:ParB/RepB/Spo0J family partition protein